MTLHRFHVIIMTSIMISMINMVLLIYITPYTLMLIYHLLMIYCRHFHLEYLDTAKTWLISSYAMLQHKSVALAMLVDD